MNYEIHVLNEKRFVLIKVVGDFTRNTGIMLAAKAVDKGSEHKISSYLFDLRQAPNTDSTFNKYAYAYRDLVNMNLAPQTRIALLTDPRDKSHDFVETVMRNAGFNATKFSEENFAVTWLTSNLRPY